MESKLLWVVLIAFLLGGWWCGCDGCWDQEQIALLQLKLFFTHIKDVENYWEERKQSSDCCEWERVECNISTGRVIQLNFTVTDDETFYTYEEEDFWSTESKRDNWYLNASLFLPFEELKSLYLSGNFIAGCVDNQGFEKLSSKLDKLEILDLSYNQLNDSILASLTELLLLKSLNLARNQFKGSNPRNGFEKLSPKLDKLEILDLSYNQFDDSILASLSELSSLKSLNLAGNQFTGSNPTNGIKRLSKLKNLETLDLSDNIFGNNIVSNLNGFTSLRSLSLQYCSLNGTVPMLEFNNLVNLKELYLSENEIESLGSLFQEKGELRLIKLEVLDLSNNLFNNSIFSFLSLLSNLKSLNLNWNSLKGPIHIKELNALSNLEELYMLYNQVNGFVPSQDNETELRLMNLKVLDLSWNFFNNNILPSLGRLSNLKSLSLEHNNLEGSINLTELRSVNLEVLYLSGNLFNNSILSSLGRFSNLKSLSFGGTNLKGSIDLTELNALTSLENLEIGCGYDINTLTDQSHNFTNLEELTLGGSFLQTNFFRMVREFTSLKRLVLYDCEINGSLILQDQRHNFTNLEELILRGSFLQTNFLHSIKEFTSLKRLSLYDCEINGSLTLQESHNFTNLEELILGDSIFQTNFLRSIGQFTSLKHLFLVNCEINENLTLQDFCESTNLQKLGIIEHNLKGNLPDCFSNLTSLETLDLSSNQLSGNIFALESLTSLKILDLSSNQFSGNISALKSLTSLETLDLSSNQFSGNISALKCLTSLQVLRLSNNYFQIPISLGPLFNLSNLKSIHADNNIIYAETQMHSSAPTFQLQRISLSCCGDVRSFPAFLYHQHDLQSLDLSNIYFKGNQFPNWLLENNTKFETLMLTNSSLSGPLQLPLASHMSLSYLKVSNNFFNGCIPVEIGAQLPSLRFLNMSKNNFNGGIPSSFGDMSSLEFLDLSNNQLSGGIPEHLAMSCPSLLVLALSNNTLQGKIFSGNFNLTNLLELQLDGNNFSGMIPNFLSKSSFLSTLDVSNNQLSGMIPRWMGNMSSLKRIIMSNNHLEGTIPVEFCQLDLILLDLSVNNISGSLPSCFSPSKIRQVHLSKNRLRGGLPNALRNSFTLVTLDMSDNFLTGSIPSWIGRLSNLSYLLLSKNNFEGRIPLELCKLSHLSLINLSHNNLSGRIPPCLKITTLEDVSEDYVDSLIAAGPSPFSFDEPIEFPIKNMYNSYKGRIIPYMSGIDLSCNKLVGEIPYEFGNFYKILVLNLSHNSLTGPIPPTFANLKQIESLDLSYNKLSGNIPPQLVGLNFMSCFIVSFNNLSGKTPERIGEFGTFDESSYRGNPYLCGEPLPKCADTGSSSPMPNALTDSEEDDGPIDIGVFYVSFIASYVVALLAIAAVLYINPYWRRAWFYHVEISTTSCYYFVLDNILPRRFHCGNM